MNTSTMYGAVNPNPPMSSPPTAGPNSQAPEYVTDFKAMADVSISRSSTSGMVELCGATPIE